MRCLIAIIVLLPFASAICGCGGGLTQADMMRHAISRKSSDDDEDEAPPSAVAAARPSPDAQATAAAPDAAPRHSTTADQPSVTPTAATAAASPHAASAVDPAPVAQGEVQTPGTLVERRARSLSNLERIAAAIRAYTDSHGAFPQTAIQDVGRQPLLSWRVELLPLLGYEELYEQFHREEPWNSAHNQQFLAAIPPVYRSPERSDERTNYLLVSGSGTLFPGGRGFTPRRVEDGLANTLLVLEVDDDASVPWTQPADYVVDFNQPARALGNLREDGFFVAWADGSVGRIQAEAVDRAVWKAMCTPDSGESFTAGQISLVATAEPAAPPPPPVVAASVAAPATSTDSAVAPASRQAVTEPTTGVTMPSGAVPAELTRKPIPEGPVFALALQQVRDEFHADYAAAASSEKKLDLANELIRESSRCRDDPARHYALLDVGWRIAAAAGDVDLAMKAVSQLEQTFAIDLIGIHAELLAATVDLRLEDGDNETVLREAASLVDAALAADRFGPAGQAHAAALAAARRSRDGRLVTLLDARSNEIKAASRAFHNIAGAIKTLVDDPDDAEANRQVGEYYCFVKGRWEEGLPLLAAGSDSRLAILAQAELNPPGDPRELVALGDRWWLQSERRPEYQTSIRARAVHWYSQAVPHLDSGHEKIRAEMRTRLADLSEMTE